MRLQMTENIPQAYREEMGRLCHHRMYYLLLMTAGLFLCYAPLDYLFFPDSFGELLYFRFAVLLFCLLLLFLNYQDRRCRYPLFLSYSLYGFSLFTLSLMIVRTGGISLYFFIGFILAVVVFSALMPLTMPQALVSGVVALACYLLAVLQAASPLQAHLSSFINNMFFLVCFVLLAVLQSWFETTSRQESFILRMQEKEGADYLDQQAEALEAEIARRSKEHQQAENRFRRLLDHIIDDVLLVDANGLLLYANPSFYEHVGLTEGDEVNLVDLVAVNEQSQLQKDLLQPVAAGITITGYQTRLTGTDDEKLEVEISGNRMERKGKPVGLQLILRDISLRKRMEEEVRRGLFLRKQTENATIMALARLSEYRDITPGNHLQRIREYSGLLAESLARKPEYQAVLGGSGVSDLAMASVLHDIGKVGIADGILFQTGPLSAEDLALTRQHTVFGGDVIKAMEKSSEVDSGFLGYAKNIAYFHHEKWDGSGYPFGLVGPEIPLEARIVALADAYESMTSSGIYGKQLSHQQAIHVLLQEAGHHFDPDIVDAVVAREQAFAAVRQSLPS